MVTMRTEYEHKKNGMKSTWHTVGRGNKRLVILTGVEGRKKQ